MKRFVIGPMPMPIADELRTRLMQVETATVGHFLHWGFMSPHIRALDHRQRVVGTAVTLALPAQDSTLLHHAVGLLAPGHIVVVDRLGDDKHACWGGGVTHAATAAGATAAVVDGMCTDPLEIAQLSFPVWCRGISPITTRTYGLGGLLNRPVACGGVAVSPGDIVLCDENGVLVIAAADVDEVADIALERQARGEARRQRVEAGEKLGDLSGATQFVLTQSD